MSTTVTKLTTPSTLGVSGGWDDRDRRLLEDAPPAKPWRQGVKYESLYDRPAAWIAPVWASLPAPPGTRHLGHGMLCPRPRRREDERWAARMRLSRTSRPSGSGTCGRRTGRSR